MRGARATVGTIARRLYIDVKVSRSRVSLRRKCEINRIKSLPSAKPHHVITSSPSSSFLLHPLSFSCHRIWCTRVGISLRADAVLLYQVFRHLLLPQYYFCLARCFLRPSRFPPYLGFRSSDAPRAHVCVSLCKFVSFTPLLSL